MAMSKDLRLIAFRVGAETFVIDIMAVRQIIKYAGTTSVPTAPSFVEGIMILRNEVIPVIDMRDAFAAEYALCKVEPSIYLRKYYNGHHSPAGNYFTAWAIKDAVVTWLDPKPSPYSRPAGRA